MKLAPPFEIYHDEIHIGDANGHVCTAESPEIAKQIVGALNEKAALTQSDAEPVRAFLRKHFCVNGSTERWISEEAETLYNSLVQSDAEPVAWRIKPPGIGPAFTFTGDAGEYKQLSADGWIAEPLYTAPPRPNASAGLIEAAELAEEYAREWNNQGETVAASAVLDFEMALRARAADAEPVAWKPDANMRAELDRSELVARALLKEIMKQTDCIEAEGNIEWHKRIHVNGELYLPDISAAVLASLYASPRPDASAGLIEAAEWHEEKMKKFRGIKTDSAALITQHHHLAATYFRARAADRSGK